MTSQRCTTSILSPSTGFTWMRDIPTIFSMVKHIDMNIKTHPDATPQSITETIMNTPQYTKTLKKFSNFSHTKAKIWLSIANLTCQDSHIRYLTPRSPSMITEFHDTWDTDDYTSTVNAIDDAESRKVRQQREDEFVDTCARHWCPLVRNAHDTDKHNDILHTWVWMYVTTMTNRKSSFHNKSLRNTRHRFTTSKFGEILMPVATNQT